MYVNTSGIILHSLKYGDSSTIITVYTLEFGRVSYLVHGVNRKKSATRSAFFQPLSLVNMEVTHQPAKELQYIKEIRLKYVFTSIPYNQIKNSIALFLAEVLYRTLRRIEVDERLYYFIESSIQTLDTCTVSMSNFHLIFLLKLSRYLGFEPNCDDNNYLYFDLMNGVFQKEKPHHVHYLVPEDATLFGQCMQTDYETMQNLKLTRQQRVKILESLVAYYRLHVPDFHGLQSLEVLKNLFD
jgi:DNA repair protein RecO (recombination protein O)